MFIAITLISYDRDYLVIELSRFGLYTYIYTHMYIYIYICIKMWLRVN